MSMQSLQIICAKFRIYINNLDTHALTQIHPIHASQSRAPLKHSLTHTHNHTQYI